MKECTLEHKPCDNCGECLICDLDRSKECDNCMKCIEKQSQYRGIKIDDIKYDEQ